MYSIHIHRVYEGAIYMALKNLLLVGGAPLTGKSTLGLKLANTENAVLLPTDAVRDWMQQVVSERDHPFLYFRKGADAKTFYSKFDMPHKLLEGQLAQGKEVEIAILAMLTTRYLPWTNVVIEGLVVTPSFVLSLKKRFPAVKLQTFFLYDGDADSIRKRLLTRGLWGSPSTESEDITQRELEWVILYNEFFKEEADKYGFTLTKV